MNLSVGFALPFAVGALAVPPARPFRITVRLATPSEEAFRRVEAHLEVWVHAALLGMGAGPSVAPALHAAPLDPEPLIRDDAHKGKRCKDRGVAKHKCCDEAIREQHGAERGQPQRTYSDGAFDKKTGQMIGRNNPVRGGLPPRVPRTRSAIVRQAIGFAKKGGVPAGPAIAAFLSGKQFPDVVVSDDASQPPGRGNTGAVYDFKFPCPKTKRPTWGKGQKERYKDLLAPRTMKLVSPTMVVAQ